MRGVCLVLAAGLAVSAVLGFAQQSSSDGPYKVLRTAKVGGDGGFDYVYADADQRRLYVARSGAAKRINVFDLDTLQPAGEIPDVGAHGAAVDAQSHHGFASSKPVVMWDTRTLKPVKNIDVQGNPDGMLLDAW